MTVDNSSLAVAFLLDKIFVDRLQWSMIMSCFLGTLIACKLKTRKVLEALPDLSNPLSMLFSNTVEARSFKHCTVTNLC